MTFECRRTLSAGHFAIKTSIWDDKILAFKDRRLLNRCAL